MRSTCLAAAIVLLCSAAFAQEDEPRDVSRVRVLGPRLQQPAVDAPIVVLAGRFVPILPPDGAPSYLAIQPAYRTYRIRPGSQFVGIKFDAPKDAEPETYEWPDISTPVLVILARDVPGKYSLQLLKNGPVETGPVENGKPLAIQVVSGNGPRPPPDPDDDDGDDVKPDPPQPTPGKPSVLIMEDVSKRPTLPLSQLSALLSVNVRKYLDSHCAAGPNGQPEWRLWHIGNTAEHESEKWRNIIAQFKAINPQPPLPYIMISNGVTGEGVPFPKTEAEALSLLRKWGGP